MTKKASNPITFVFMMAAAVGGAFYAKPYVDSAVDLVTSYIPGSEAETTEATEPATKTPVAKPAVANDTASDVTKMSAEAEKMKSQCMDIGGEIGSVLSGAGIESFSYMYQSPLSEDSPGTCTFQMVNSKTGNTNTLETFYIQSSFESAAAKTEVIKGLLQLVGPDNMEKVAVLIPQILAAFEPKTPAP